MVCSKKKICSWSKYTILILPYLAKARYSDSNTLILLEWSHFNMIFSDEEKNFFDFFWNVFYSENLDRFVDCICLWFKFPR